MQWTSWPGSKIFKGKLQPILNNSQFDEFIIRSPIDKPFGTKL